MRPRDGFLLGGRNGCGQSGASDIAPHDHPCESRGPLRSWPFDMLRANGKIRPSSWLAPPVRGEPVEPCEREGARAYIEEGGMDSCSGAGMTVGARQDARYPFSANLPDRYLWMTLDSSV